MFQNIIKTRSHVTKLFIKIFNLHSAEINLFLSALLKIGQTRPRPSTNVYHIYTKKGHDDRLVHIIERDSLTHTEQKIYHVTNTESVRRRALSPGTPSNEFSPPCTMQSMLNRITINCINSKNTTDSKHCPSAHNRPCIAQTYSTTLYFLDVVLLQKFIYFTRDHWEETKLTTYRYIIFVGGNYVICACLRSIQCCLLAFIQKISTIYYMLQYFQDKQKVIFALPCFF